MPVRIQAIEDLYQVPEHGKAGILGGELVLLSPRNPSGNRGRWTEGSHDVISRGGVRRSPVTPMLARGE